MTPQIADIQHAICEWFHVRMLDLTSQRRNRSVARPRQIAMYLTREMTPLTTVAIGRHFGNRDHTTVIHACHTVEAIMRHDPAFAAAVERLRWRIASGDQFSLPIDQA